MIGQQIGLRACISHLVPLPGMPIGCWRFRLALLQEVALQRSAAVSSERSELHHERAGAVPPSGDLIVCVGVSLERRNGDAAM